MVGMLQGINDNGKATNESTTELSVTYISEGEEETTLFYMHKNTAWWVAISPDGNYIASVSSDKEIVVWSKNDGKCYEFSNDKTHFCCKFTPDSSFLITACIDGECHLWDCRGNHIHSYGKSDIGKDFTSANSTYTLPPPSCIWGVDISNDSRLVAGACTDNTLRLWKMDGEPVHIYNGHEDKVVRCAFSPDASLILSSSYDKTLKLWDTSEPYDCRQTFKGHTEWIVDCRFSPTGLHVLSGSLDNTARIWDLDGNCIQIFKSKDFGIFGVSFSNRGDLISISSGDNNIAIWKTDGTLVTNFEGHKKAVNVCNWSPDDEFLVSASDDHSIRFWQTYRLEETYMRAFLTSRLCLPNEDSLGWISMFPAHAETLKKYTGRRDLIHSDQQGSPIREDKRYMGG